MGMKGHGLSVAEILHTVTLRTIEVLLSAFAIAKQTRAGNMISKEDKKCSFL